MFTGQFDTDMHIAQFFDQGFIGTCVDVGAAQPINGNNTFYFETKGWTTYCIEPNVKHISNLKAVRKNVYNFAVGAENLDSVEFTICTLSDGNQEAVSSLKIDSQLLENHRIYSPTLQTVSVQLRTLDSFFEELEIQNVDFISIDTEGTELDVLKGFNILKYKPKLFVIENNFNIPDLEEYLKQYNYSKAKRVAVNDFYILN